MPRLIDSASLLAIATALLFLAGACYQIGFNDKLSLNSIKLTREIHQYLLEGFFITVFPFLTVIVWVMILLVLVIGCLVIKSAFKKKEKKKEKEKEKTEIKADTELTALFTNLFLIVTLVYASMYFFAVKPFQKGQAEAKEIIATYENDRHKNEHSIELEVSKNKTHPLTLLSCGKTNCAGIDPSTNKIHYFIQTAPFSFKFKKSPPNNPKQ